MTKAYMQFVIRYLTQKNTLMDGIVNNIFDSENSEYTFESCGTNNRVIFHYNYDNFEWFQFLFWWTFTRKNYVKTQDE